MFVGGDYTAVDAPGSSVYFPHREVSSSENFLRGRESQKLFPAQTPPHGYRSAVAYSLAHKAWITVGPNGTDLSTDDGRNWRALKPGKDDAPGADRDWNALSLPFVVGPKGRVGRLNASAVSGLDGK